LPTEEERTSQNTEEPKEEFKEIVLLSPSLDESKHISVLSLYAAYAVESLERTRNQEYFL
jgi:hypothetical protein